MYLGLPPIPSYSYVVRLSHTSRQHDGVPDTMLYFISPVGCKKLAGISQKLVWSLILSFLLTVVWSDLSHTSRQHDGHYALFHQHQFGKKRERVSQKLARNNGYLVTPLPHHFAQSFARFCTMLHIAHSFIRMSWLLANSRFWQTFSLFTPPVANQLSHPETEERDSLDVVIQDNSIW